MKCELHESDIDLIIWHLERRGEKEDVELIHRLDLMRHGHWRDTSNEVWYCEVHKRQAEFMFQHPTADNLLNPPRHECDPDLGGITMPCRCRRLLHPLVTKDGIAA